MRRKGVPAGAEPASTDPVRRGIVLTTVTLAAFTLTHLAVQHVLGRGIAPAYLAPVLVAAWTLGTRAGLLVAAGALPVLVGALALTGTPPAAALLTSATGFTAFAAVAAGLGVGGARDLARRFRTVTTALARAHDRGAVTHRVLTEVAEANADLVARVRRDGTVIGLNDPGRDLLGIARTVDVDPFHVRDVTLPGTWDTLRTEAFPAAAGDGAWRGTMALLTGDGAEAPANATVVPEHAADVFIVIARRTTEGGAAGEPLHVSEERFRGIFENAPVGIYRATPDGRILLANPALVGMLGFASFQDMAARNLEDLTNGHSTLAWFRDRLEATGEVKGMESAWTRADGRTMHTRESARVIRDANGDVLYHEGIVEDVTARKEAEDALERREREFRDLAENVPDVVARFDADHRYVYVNPAVEQVAGIPPDALLGRTHEDLGGDPEVAALWAQHIDHVLETGEETVVEYAVEAGDGTRHYQSRLVPDGLEGGTVKTVLSVTRDVTEFKRAEAEQREANARVTGILERITDAFIALDDAWRFTYVNTQAERLIGLGKEDLLGRRLWDGFPDIKGTMFAEACERARRERRAVHFETYYPPLRAWLEVHAYPAPDGLSVYFRDVTERKEQEEKLRLSEERFRTVIENVTDVITLLDADGIIRYESPSVASITGYTPEERTGRDIFQFVHPEDLARVREEFLHGLREPGSTRSASFRVRHRDGSWRDLEVAGTNLLDNPAIKGFIVTSRDVTERKRLEREAEAHREALARSERLSALGTLVAGVAHEINNPLMYMRGSLDLALMDLDDLEEPENDVDVAGTRAAVRRALGGAERISRITRALKSVARQGPGEHEPVDVREVLESVTELVRVGLPDTITLEATLPETPLLVHGDASELHQALLNLTKNAVEAMSEDGGVLTLSVDQDDGRVVLRVADTGPGIPREVLTHAFDPFFTTKPHGTGLGLAIVHSIVDAHEGNLRVDAAPGEGTTFTIRIPLLNGNRSGS